MSATSSISTDVVVEAKRELAAAFRAAAFYGYNEGIDNHLSLAVPGHDDLFLLNRYGPHWSEITPADILLIDLEGSVVDGDGDWEVTAFIIHRAVHRARPTARCVLHTHMPYATAVAMTDAGLDTRASQNAMYFHGSVVRVPFGGLADGAEEGDRLAGAIRDGATVALLDNHGVLVTGRTPADAWHKLYMLERACQTDVLATSTGRTLIRVPDDVAAHTAAQWEREAAGGAADAVFAAERRLLERESPGFLD